jgi:hypothetical protein
MPSMYLPACLPADAQREQLTALLDDIYDDFVDCVARSRGKTREEVGRLAGPGGSRAVLAAAMQRRQLPYAALLYN